MREGPRPVPCIVAGLLMLAGLAVGFAGAAVDSAANPEANPQADSQAQGSHINLVTITGSINPASADYVIRGLEQSEQEGAEALLIELDTPGGLVSATRDIIQAMLNAQVPTIVYVTPRGAWAISAGTFITTAANVAAMAPGTSIGAAHPVSAVGGTSRPPDSEPGSEKQDAAPEGPQVDVSAEKMENAIAAMMESIARERERNVEWVVRAVRESVAIGEDEALELGVIDLVANSRSELLESLDGHEVKIAGKTRNLALSGLPVRALEMTILQQLFNFLADPNVAILLFFAGMIGLYAEFNSPGLIFPGVTGAVCLLLAAIAFQILPFSWVGLILMLAGIVLFVAEVFVTSFGLLFAAGVLCFLLGGTMLFDKPDLSDLTVSFWSVLVPAVVGVAIFGGIVVFLVGRSLWVGQTAGVDELIGTVGRADSALDPEGRVYVRGEYWNARADERIADGESVEVTAVEGLTIRVRRVA
ncbi:MAG: nodulation protein NfeD [Deltaproteobacteria bacterium]|nr:nodulation protein NfeD [Deltaproteobacteria bacterium]MBW2420540.1 nodulation protein NfeD [Deltaproteobacteria bacterium]